MDKGQIDVEGIHRT